MKYVILLFAFVSLSFSQMYDEPNKNAPKELAQFQFMVGKMGR